MTLDDLCTAFKHRKRFWIFLVMFFVNLTNSITAKSMIFALQPMTNNSAIQQIEYEGKERRISPDLKCYGNRTSRNLHWKDGIYPFSSSDQAWILSGLSFGQLLGTVFSLYLYDFFHMGPVYSISVLWIGFLSLGLPFMADKTGFAGVLLSRIATGIYMGLLTPANSLIACRWATLDEKNLVLGVLGMASNVGRLSLATSGIIIESIGWEFLFYMPGVAAILCSILMLILYTENPKHNRFLTENEKALLKRTWEADEKKSKMMIAQFVRRRKDIYSSPMAISRLYPSRAAPIFQALKYFQVWVLLSGTFGYAWSYEGTTYIQMYLTHVHGYSSSKAAIFSCVPTDLSMIIFTMIGNLFAEHCIQTSKFNKKSVRRIGGILLGMSGFFFLFLALFPCHLIESGLVFILLISSFRSGYVFSVMPMCFDLSPTYQGALFTISRMFSFLPGFLVPVLMTVFGKETKTEWMWIFMTSALVIFLSVGMYVFWLHPEIQDFDDIVKRTKSDDRDEKLLDEESETFASMHSEANLKYRKPYFEAKQNISQSIWDEFDEENLPFVRELITKETARLQMKMADEKEIPF